MNLGLTPSAKAEWGICPHRNPIAAATKWPILVQVVEVA